MQSSLKKSEFWFKAMGLASFVNMTCSAIAKRCCVGEASPQGEAQIALADMLQPNQQKPLIFPENLKSLAPRQENADIQS